MSECCARHDEQAVLGIAWAEVEEVLPEGYYLTLTRNISGSVTSHAWAPTTRRRPAPTIKSGQAATPAAALLALAGRLRDIAT